MKLEKSMGAVTNMDATLAVETMLFQRFKFVEELRHADNAGAADEVVCIRVDQARRQDVKVISDLVDDNGMTGVVTSSRASNDLEGARKDVDKLSLA